MAQPSPFLEPGNVTSPGNLAIILLSRDNLQPITLEQSTGAVDGYLEGATLNTRFGSFPHSTLLNIPWGSQVRASAVDTGSRGRKRRREATDEDTPTTTGPDDDVTDVKSKQVKKAVTASSGFIHILRPTPELWTSSLPHRTQVVYTPDYSYILQRIRAVPGTRIIEAGAGSGSFTHASARAVYNGYPKDEDDVRGKVFSFEYHEPRYNKMQEEIHNHKLDGIVKISHRDVYNEGFLVDGKSPRANAVFLDLPAPWEALHHLSRQRPDKASKDGDAETPEWVSPLDPKKSVHICTFSPCIEQVTRTIEELRLLGWTDIDMVEISHRRFNVVRERIGANLPNERGNILAPADVTEAVERLKEINRKTKEFHKAQLQAANGDGDSSAMDVDTPAPAPKSNGQQEDSKPWMHGKLYHRPETDLKTHTSYLTFAVLPREWTEEDEAAAWEKFPCGKEGGVIGSLNKQARKQQTREKLAAKKKRKQGNDTQAAAAAGDTEDKAETQ
ncbi:TRNA (adenine(58)-N(1))-methyltransferase catalytic subunit TRM61 [Fusarium keratoplasticum]|uniref:tRNA (Adenine(58)-N(1))-methyltransferase catalytic subunit TRM61 n=1 Tax=Fusarium keratoplasticum TaxID=1328300 RepID=A0ACC0QKE0_9HYPO|nr:TRNA (adenine(58)-N(1))-methyltransferase catalytic subunit TRM61 [Fusarium keratoplasticum]KAI8657785.1 TRNA (adenine(58)-N(1))-methyltransferase catalytic subunit TRM61 [Fusarium keratoplasticum]KAI8658745.1 TRNA (adenine(58)-N(1))-methyltransferase catalytic subunit TRM61 [Fusarium keratoplasticum]